jgi:hypothetical protein
MSLAGSGVTIEVAGTINDHVGVSTTVTIEQWPGQSPGVVDGGIGVSSTGNLTLDGLTVTGSLDDGIYCGGENCTITDSTITGNRSFPCYECGGAGIQFGDPDSHGTGTITDSTITDNASGGRGSGGGAVYNVSYAVTITGSTITDNTAGGAAAGIVTLPTDYYGAKTTIGDTIVANNYSYWWDYGRPPHLYTASTYPYHNCFGRFTSVGYNSFTTSVGYNLTSDITGTACGFTKATDEVNVNPNLGPLADNGGSTETMLPAASGPAVGVIPSPTTLNGVPVCGPGAFDQRGLSRPTPGSMSCAIGAVEPATELTYLQLSVRGVGPGTSLYDKLTQAQKDVAGKDTAGACGLLDAFMKEVKARIPQTKAASLVATATDVKVVLGC